MVYQRTMRPFEGDPDLPTYMWHPDIGELTMGRRCNLGVTKTFLADTLADPVMAASAADRLEAIPGIGLYSLPLREITNPAGVVIGKRTFNAWTEEAAPPDPELIRGHGHLRDGEIWSVIPPGSEQEIDILHLLSDAAKEIPGAPSMECVLGINHRTVGRAETYNVRTLGIRRARMFTIYVSETPYQKFPSTTIHNVRYRGRGVGFSIQDQGPLEPPGLNDLRGFMDHKGLSPSQAEAAEAQSNEVASLSTGGVTGSTLMVRDDPNFVPAHVERGPIRVDPKTGLLERLFEGAIYTIEQRQRKGYS
jgi:hypothetical protein